MKKEERLGRLFGEIDDDLVAGAAAKPMPLKVWLPRVTAVAAAVALTVGLAVAQPWATEKPPVTNHTAGDCPGVPMDTVPNNGSTTTTTVQQNTPNGEQGVPTDTAPAIQDPSHVAPPKPTHTQKGTSTTAAEIGNPDIWYEQPWEEWPLWRKFSHFELPIPEGYNGKMNFAVCEATIDKGMVEEYLEDVELYGYDGPNETSHTITAKLYRIKGFSSIAAVALQYDGKDAYYPAVNEGYTPATLNDFLNDFNLRENLRIGIVYESRIDGNENSREFHGLTVEKTWELLMQDTTLSNLAYNGDLIVPNGSCTLSVAVEMPTLGNYSRFFLSIWEEGILSINIGNMRTAYDIGEDTVADFYSYLQEYCRIVTTTRTDAPDNTNTHTTMTSPAQPPQTTRHTIKG